MCCRFRDSFAPVVTVWAIHSTHRVSTFHIPALDGHSLQLRGDGSSGRTEEDGDDDDAAPEYGKSQTELVKDSPEVEGGDVGTWGRFSLAILMFDQWIFHNQAEFCGLLNTNAAEEFDFWPRFQTEIRSFHQEPDGIIPSVQDDSIRSLSVQDELLLSPISLLQMKWCCTLGWLGRRASSWATGRWRGCRRLQRKLSKLKQRSRRGKRSGPSCESPSPLLHQRLCRSSAL